jgi:hypothetical protein
LEDACWAETYRGDTAG